MTLRITAVTTSVIAAAGLVVGIGVSAAPADAAGSYPSQICITSNPGLNQCINNWGGHLAIGNPIKYEQKGSGGGYKYNNWDVNRVGTVSPAPAWPFTSGSGLNDRYEGDAVLEFNYQGQYASPTGYCADSTGYSVSTGSGQLQLRGCGGSAFQLFVLSNYSALIPVGPSDDGYAAHASYPVWLGCAKLNCVNGQPVIATNVQGYNRPYGFLGPA
jgi:hypothetical protein